MQPQSSTSTDEQSNTDDALPRKKSYIDASDPEWAVIKARQEPEWRRIAELEARKERNRKVLQAERRKERQEKLKEEKARRAAEDARKQEEEKRKRKQYQREAQAIRDAKRKRKEARDARKQNPASSRHPRRRMPRPHDLRDRSIDRTTIFWRDAFTCIYCRRSAQDDDTLVLHVDHIFPRSKGGRDIAGNLVTSCAECNISKRDYVMPTKRLNGIRAEVRKRNKEIGLLSSKHMDL